MSPAQDFQQIGMWDQQRLRPVCAYAQTDQSLCLSLEYSMRVKVLTKHHLKFLSLKVGCTGSSESILVKMPHCWKSHVTAQIFFGLVCGLTSQSTAMVMLRPSINLTTCFSEQA